MNLEQFFMQFQDYLAPKLDTYEQAIYLYLFRHSKLIGKDEIVVGFKSARTRMACGVGEKGKPMSENTAYLKSQSLQEKGLIQIIDSERSGRRIILKMPDEIPGIIPEQSEPTLINIGVMDFFEVPENRLLILKREDHRCFYCLRSLTKENHVIEHVISRPDGDNSYRNVVAACRQCNNKKDNSSAEDYLRTLYRASLLDNNEFESRLSHLERLRKGELIPEI